MGGLAQPGPSILVYTSKFVSSPSGALATAAAALAELGAGFILLLELAGARF